jgi:hypothetical protein
VDGLGQLSFLQALEEFLKLRMNGRENRGTNIRNQGEQAKHPTTTAGGARHRTRRRKARFGCNASELGDVHGRTGAQPCCESLGFVSANTILDKTLQRGDDEAPD